MKIFTTTDDDHKAFKRLFHKHEVRLLPQDYVGESCDLIIFAGGSDVHPSFYGGQIFGNWYDKKRDVFEQGVFANVIAHRIKAKKIMGVCRGMQAINVFLGGTLVHDIATVYGKDHPQVHGIRWRSPEILGFLEKVNSSHHQCISHIGDRLSYKILATEPNTGIIESVSWGDGMILGVQFHPEYWRPSPLADKIADSIESWVMGKSDNAVVESPKKRIFYATYGS